MQFLSLLAQLSEVDIKALIEYKDLLLKALSSLNESKTFDAKECTQLVNILEETFLDKLQIGESKKKEICKNIKNTKKSLENVFLKIKLQCKTNKK
ncbi:TPA: hypothetical protein R1706_001348 [Campylobacter lari]|nr:hypothetical protein [Campylobacter lari]